MVKISLGIARSFRGAIFFVLPSSGKLQAQQTASWGHGTIPDRPQT